MSDPVLISPAVLERFLRAGGVLRLQDFLEWDEETQEAAAKIGDSITGERIFALSMAINDPTARAAVLAAKDGGDALERTFIDRALDIAEAGMRVEEMRGPRTVRVLGKKGGG